MIERLFETLGSLGGPWAYLAVGLLAAGESSIGVGLVVPGETGMIVGGFIVSQGNADFGLMWLVAVTGAVVGDSVGYEIGRFLGPRIRRTRVGRFIGEERWQKAQDYLSQRGGKAVFLGRFVAVVRSIVPAVAGISHMPYPRFLVWNAAGALLWATIYVSLGYAAGRSYEQVADAVEGAGYVLLALLVLIAAVVLGARWAARHPDRVRSLGERVTGWRGVTWVERRLSWPVSFVRRRFSLDDAFGFSLTVGLVALIVGTLALARVAAYVSDRQALVDVDLPVVRWFAEHRAESLTDAMEWLTHLGSAAVLGPAVGLVALVWLVRARRWGAVAFLGAALLGGVVATDVVKGLVERPRPPAALAVVDAGGFAFPSGHTVQATVAYGAIAYLAGSVLRRWTGRVIVWAGAVILSLVVGFTRAYLGTHWLSDVLGAYALGVVWLSVVITVFGTGSRFTRQYGRRGRAGSRAPTSATQSTRVSSRTA